MSKTKDNITICFPTPTKPKDLDIDDIPLFTFFTGKLGGEEGLFYKVVDRVAQMKSNNWWHTTRSGRLNTYDYTVYDYKPVKVKIEVENL